MEKNRQATAFVEQARTIKMAASQVAKPIDLLLMKQIEPALLVAAGISDKAIGYLQAEDKRDALLSLIHEYLEPRGENWVEELVYRFLLTRGDTIGGMMRNIAGVLAQRKMTRFIISAFAVQGMPYQYLDSGSNLWLPQPQETSGIELRVRGLSWNSPVNHRTLVYNCKVPIVGKNIDLCLFNCSASAFANGKILREQDKSSDFHIALGELKGGMDPAGADEHWKTAHSALNRIEKAFRDSSNSPHLFFVGAAIERAMATEIWELLESGSLANAANLTDENQLASICLWLCQL